MQSECLAGVLETCGVTHKCMEDGRRGVCVLQRVRGSSGLQGFVFIVIVINTAEWLCVCVCVCYTVRV